MFRLIIQAKRARSGSPRSSGEGFSKWKKTGNDSQSSWRHSSPKQTFGANVKPPKELLKHMLSSFPSLMSKKISELGLDKSLVQETFPKFSSELLRNPPSELLEAISHNTNSRLSINNGQHRTLLVPLFYKFLQTNYAERVGTQFSKLVELSDLSEPADWYPDARKMTRMVTMHVGPTNSGKTYAALQALSQAQSGIYCGPLRLLAYEIYEKMNSQNIPFNLVTGEERRVSDDVNRTSCTVEMVPLNSPVQVVVIDEIQMIADPQRGWAWTQAFLGAQAEELHLCGEAVAVPLIEKLCQVTGDTFQVKHYERKTELQIEKQSVKGDLSLIQPGDAIVAFSRNEVFALQKAVEKATKMKAAIIYGTLPPETRAEQAKLFNDPESEFKVLVATDAIGMGLNLNIRRIVFSTISKYHGSQIGPKNISISSTKQIAGRAGRFGTNWEKGYVTAFTPQDLKFIQKTYFLEAPILDMAGLHPQVEQIERFSEILQNQSLPVLLTRFQELTQVSGDFFLCNLEPLVDIAKLLVDIPLSLRDRYTFTCSPVNVRDTIVSDALISFAKSYASGVPYDVTKLPELNVADSKELLRNLELQHKVVMLYLWLANRFRHFDQVEYMTSRKNRTEILIGESLMKIGIEFKPKKSQKIYRTFEES